MGSKMKVHAINASLGACTMPREDKREVLEHNNTHEDNTDSLWLHQYQKGDKEVPETD